MRSQEKEVEWNVLDVCFAGLGLLMLGVWDPGAVPQLLRSVVVFDCANSNYRKHAKGSVSVGHPRCVRELCRGQVALRVLQLVSRGAASPGAARAPRPGRAPPGART